MPENMKQLLKDELAKLERAGHSANETLHRIITAVLEEIEQEELRYAKVLDGIKNDLKDNITNHGTE